MGDDWLRYAAPGRCSKCCGTLPPDRPDACDVCGPDFDPNVVPEPKQQALTTAWSVKGPLTEEDPFAARPIGRLIGGVLYRPWEPSERTVVDEDRVFTTEELAALPVMAPVAVADERAEGPAPPMRFIWASGSLPDNPAWAWTDITEFVQQNDPSEPVCPSQARITVEGIGLPMPRGTRALVTLPDGETVEAVVASDPEPFKLPARRRRPWWLRWWNR